MCRALHPGRVAGRPSTADRCTPESGAARVKPHVRRDMPWVLIRLRFGPNAILDRPLREAVCRTRRRTASVLEPERLCFAVRWDRNMVRKQSFRGAVSITSSSLSKRPRSCKGRLHSRQRFRQVYIDFPIWLPPVLLQPVGMIAQTFFQGPLFVPAPAGWRFSARLIAGRVHVVSNCGFQRASFCKPRKNSQPAFK